MKTIGFISKLPKESINDLKSLLFFNPEQRKVVSGIEAAILKYGLPEIITENEYLRVKVGNLIDVQSVFAIDKYNGNEILAGVLLYFRESEENMVLLHIAVREEYTISGSKGRSYLTLYMLNEFIKDISKIKGINKLTIYYTKDKKGIIKI